ncbi:MAG: CRISPR-associated endonuclease Cas2 [Spirochaetes bacterium GWB1_36_13]|nr:MAG: CRISPR-associated endonuclease Cas2 [Spirochaetes bacterium GWB1_36_13]
MNIWVVYDIESTPAGDKRRSKIAKTMLQMGLYRVQKSVFAGDLAKNRFDELFVYAGKLINPDADSVYLFPMCKEDFEAVKILGKGFDKELVSDKIKDFFF